MATTFTLTWWAGSTPRNFSETGDALHSQGWTALIVNTAGTGKREGVSYTEPGQPLQLGKDMQIGQGFYAIMPSPVNGSIWGTLQATGPDRPGAVVRINLGPNPPQTALSEISKIYRCRASGRAVATLIPKAWSGYR